MSKVIGIDLGSTFSAVAVVEGGRPTAIANSEGERTTPSVISITENERKVGSAAKRQMVVCPKNTVNIIKRFMGATYDESAEAIKHVQYDIVNKEGKPYAKIDDREYSPEELSAMILQKMKKTAEDYIGESVKDAVITVPAFFSDAARQATKTAGELAGLNVLRVIAEPTAAILSSNIDMKEDAKYLVVDFGGSTEDNSVAEISDNMVEILSTNGDVYLGGTDLDKALADYLVSRFKDEEGIDLTDDPQAMTRVLEAAEKAKIELSNSPSTDINLPYIKATADGVKHMNITVTRAVFDKLITPYIDRLIECAKTALKEADVEGSDLKGILLVGGSCRIPLVKERLEKEIGAKLIESANLDLAVAEGAALQGSIMKHEVESDLLLVDVTPLAYGIETLGGVMTTLIEANATIPCKHKETFTTAQDNQPSVDVRVLQGNRPMAKDNKEIALFKLDGILPARRGVPQIEVTFDINADGILKVSAIDKGTNKEQNITIQSNSLSKEEIERMKAEAEQYAEQDKKEKELAEALNKGQSIIFSQEKLIEESKDKISEADVTELNGYVEEMKKAVADKNINSINSLEQKINEKWNKISEAMYSQASSAQNEQQATEETPNDSNGEETVQDADFEEVK